jgi:hypothetical protein
LWTLSTVREPPVGATAGADRSCLDTAWLHSSALEEDGIRRSYGKVVSIAALAQSTARLGARSPSPCASDFLTDFIATGADRRAKGDVDVADA